MRTLRAIALTLAALTLLACETPTAPASQPLVVSSDGSALTLTNSNSWPVFYMALDPNILAVASGTIADFALCANPASCPSVPGKSNVRVPYTDIAGYYPGLSSVQVTQWRLRRSSTGDYAVIDVQSVDANIQQGSR